MWIWLSNTEHAISNLPVLPEPTKDKFLPHKTEERLNAATHGIGTVLACIGAYVLLQDKRSEAEYATESLILYCCSIILLFSASTAYHVVAHPAWKKRFRVLDHICIYILIAGTYSPVALISLREGNGWLIFYTIWGIALLGTVLKLFFTGKFEYVSLFLYLFMGWLIVFDIGDLIRHTSRPGLIMLAAGGAFYTIGVLFYSIRSIPYNHLIWHFFVLGGAICHWCYMWLEYS
jgi:hemolysin III